MVESNQIYEFGPLRLDTRARQLLRENTPVPLTPKSFELLQILVENHGRALSKAELQQALWPNSHVEEGNLPFQVSVLRKALGEEAGKWIETIPRHGYRWSAPVVLHPATDLPVAPDDGNVAAARRRRQLYLAVFGLVLFAITAGIFLASRPGTGGSVLAPVPLTTFQGSELTPSLSSDGKDVAFVWDGESGSNWDIYVKLGGVEDPLRITSSPEVDFNPDWSPDGRQIAFARQLESGAIDILVKPYPDGPERILGQARACFMFAAQIEKILDWHPDGEHLVVAGAVSGRGCGLSALSIQTGAVMPLTEPPLPSMMDIAPAISPDGRTLAFMRGSIWPNFSIHTVALSAKLKPIDAPRPVTMEKTLGLWPAWLPGSKEIVFSGGSSGAEHTLFRVLASGGAKPVQIHGLDPVANLASISSDGSLAYVTRPPLKSSIQRLEFPPGPRSPPKVTEIASSTYLQQAPAYSPDGTQIAFESERSGGREIWISSADGTQLRRLTHFEGQTVQSPRWSPDGTRIACSVALQGQRDIFVIDSQRGSPQRLTSDAHDDVGASWSRDGKWIYFHSNRSGEYQVWKMPAAGGESLQLTGGGGFNPQESPDGRFVYFTKAGQQTSLWRLPTGGGPEVRVLDRIFQLAGAVVVEDGVYFMVPPDPSNHSSAPEFKLRFLDLPSGGTGDLASIPGPIGWGLSVAPDRKSVLFVRNRTGTFDLKLVRDVR